MTPFLIYACFDVCFQLRGGHFIDARRISDGKLVYMKQVVRGSDELGFLEFLSSEEIRADPRNHCVPLLDVLTDVVDENLMFIVMPFLRPFEIPEFQTVGDLLHFGDQIIEVRLDITMVLCMLIVISVWHSFMSMASLTGALKC